jgi:phosphoglycolate phosphatase
MIKNIIFDLDGTLIDSAEDIINCLKLAYSYTGVKYHVEIGREAIGPSLNKIFHLISPSISGEEERSLVNCFRNCYDNCGCPRTVLYNGISEMLIKLKNNNQNLFVVTNKPNKSTNSIINNLKCCYFDEIVCIDSCKEIIGSQSKSTMVSYLINKRNLNNNLTVMVGDSIEDVRAAQANNLISIAVFNGYGDENSIRKSQPDYVLNKTKDLLNLISLINKIAVNTESS